MRINQEPRRRARIEIIPLIDCMFLLLVFFIYSMLSMTIHRGIQVNLPAAETAQIDRQDYISISITQDERIFINKEEKSLTNLLEHLREEHQKRSDQPVFINADQAVRYQIVIEVLDSIRSAGFTQVSLETREKSESS